jgi:ATP-binding cassette subfamily B protein
MAKFSEVRGEIEFANVTFGYDPAHPVIHDLNLHIRPGAMIGVVGTTGAGKSTLISLLCRFYDVQQGGVSIDGVDVRNMSQHDLAKIVGLVQQEPYIYSGSVFDNIRLFDETITRGEAIAAAKFVGADPLIMSMAEGYDTLVTERGSGLSAGERQLISFARIIVFRPKVLILDEATANLDSATEQLLQQALSVVSQGRTTIIIAHRLSTIMHADNIIVMRYGVIAEQGTHAELLAKEGYYKELYDHSVGKIDAAQ